MPEGRTVRCDGCGEDVPVKDHWREWLATPLGWTVGKYHRVRECVEAGREAIAVTAGGPVKHIEPKERESKL